MKKIIFLIIIFLFINTLSWASTHKNVVGEVLEVVKAKDSYNQEILKVKILEGKERGQVIKINRQIIEYSFHDFNLSEGDNILIELYTDENNSLSGRFINIWRIEKLKTLSLIFIISIILFGGLKGILSISSLLFSAYIIVKFMIPGILKGYNIILVSILSALLIVTISFILIAGFTKKSYVSILGTIGGTITAGLIAYSYSKLMKVTGMADENVVFLIRNIGLDLDYGNLYISSILLGTIGAVMDVSMSITTSMFEIKKQSPRIGTLALIQSGFHIGKDVMSTMVNTLILAYSGSSMLLIIVYFLSDIPYIHALNTEILISEIIRSLCSSIGLVITIPLTVFIAAYSLK